MAKDAVDRFIDLFRRPGFGLTPPETWLPKHTNEKISLEEAGEIGLKCCKTPDYRRHDHVSGFDGGYRYSCQSCGIVWCENKGVG